ncbi:MAG: MFS transporter [Lachnospiraceae bacterium]|nr:MFS transporter [Lachnospiraceae bacterium]MBR4143861.1 MFS transporter [Lachnospiraceae bacterium]
MSKGYKKFLLLWAGELISSIGGGLTSFGLGIYVFNETGSAAGMSLVTLLAFLPTLLLSVPAGVLADRFDRRLLMMIGDGFSGLGILFILICMKSGGATLVQICIGVTVSAVFSSLLEPAYRSTVTDILTKEEFSKANGLVSLAGSARYLFSPVIAGLLLTVSDISLLLIIDICTFFVTITTTAIVRKGVKTKRSTDRAPFFESMKEGWRAVHSKKGIFLLIMVSSAITMFMGVLQVLVKPMLLAFTDSKTVGIAESVCACGMLAAALVLGIFGIKKGYARVLKISFFLAGIFMIGMSLIENIIPICIFGFLFFAMLPIANNCMDYMARTNIPDELQGRAWGFIGFLSQLGYVVAYAVSGVGADGLGALTGKGVGRGAAIMIFISGILLAVTALTLLRLPEIKELEK